MVVYSSEMQKYLALRDAYVEKDISFLSMLLLNVLLLSFIDHHPYLKRNLDLFQTFTVQIHV
jgi:hypothetical protein